MFWPISKGPGEINTLHYIPTARGVGRMFSERCDCRSVSEVCEKY